MDINNFIQCHGLVKDEIIKNNKESIRLDNRFYAIKQDNNWILLSWNDEQTCYFICGNKTEISLYRAGKKLHSESFGSKQIDGLLSACLEFYEVQDKLVNTKYEKFSKL